MFASVAHKPRMMAGARPRYSLCERVAEHTVAEFSRPHGQLEPPIPVEALASSLGFQVLRLFSVADEFSGLVSLRHRLIGINGNHHRHRQRFTIAHEISHIALKHPPESHCTGRQIAVFNVEADACASELLIPQSLLARSFSRCSDASFLARIFDVSEEAMALKLRAFQLREVEVQ